MNDIEFKIVTAIVEPRIAEPKQKQPIVDCFDKLNDIERLTDSIRTLILNHVVDGSLSDKDVKILNASFADAHAELKASVIFLE